MNLDQFNKRISEIIRRYARGANRDEQADLRQECLLLIVTRRAEIEEWLKRDPEAATQKIHWMLKRRVRYLRQLREQEQACTESLDAVNLDCSEEPSGVMLVLNRLPKLEQYVVRETVLNERSDYDVGQELGRSKQRIAEIRAHALTKLEYLLR